MATKSLPKEEVKLPKPEVELPKPEVDLPKPEKTVVKPVEQPQTATSGSYKPYNPSFLFLKLLALALVLILIFLSSFALLQNNSTKSLPPTPTSTKPTDETANWKTYEENGFSFKYPLNWKYTKNTNYEFKPFNGDASLIGVRISFGRDYTEKEIKDYIDFHGTKPSKDDLVPTVYVFYNKDNSGRSFNLSSFATTSIAPNVKSLNLGNLQATQYIWSCQSNCVDIAFKQNGYIFDFKISNYTADELNELYQVLSTFKFTDQNSQVDTSSWKIYSNSTYFFKYPSAWTFNTYSYGLSFSSPLWKFSDNLSASQGSTIKIEKQSIKENNINDFLDNMASGGFPAVERKNIVVNGVSGLEWKTYGDHIHQTTGFLINGVLYTVTLESATNLDYKNDLNIYNAVLSTVKFTQ